MLYFYPQRQTFYDTAIHGEDIVNQKQGLIEITREQHIELLNALNRGAKVLNDLSIIEKPSYLHEWDKEQQAFILPKGAEENALKQAKAQKVNELNTLSQNLINTQSGANELPDFEVQSWTLQAIEAKAWQNDKTAQTPVLDNIALKRGIDANLLKEKALQKTLAYEQLVAYVLGIKQRYELMIKQADTLDALNNIKFDFDV